MLASMLVVLFGDNVDKRSPIAIDATLPFRCPSVYWILTGVSRTGEMKWISMQ